MARHARRPREGDFRGTGADGRLLARGVRAESEGAVEDARPVQGVDRSALEADLHEWHKQHRTATRIYGEMREMSCEGGRSLVQWFDNLDALGRVQAVLDGLIDDAEPVLSMEITS